MGVSINVNFDMISPLRGQRKMPSQRSSADTNYLVNSGGVIFAAQEQRLKTPASLALPEACLGNPAAVTQWLSEHS